MGPSFLVTLGGNRKGRVGVLQSDPSLLVIQPRVRKRALNQDSQDPSLPLLCFVVLDKLLLLLHIHKMGIIISALLSSLVCSENQKETVYMQTLDKLTKTVIERSGRILVA